MKVSLPNGGKKKEVPPLPLKPEEVTEDNKLKLTKFKLRTNLTQADSPTYSLTILKLFSLRAGILYTPQVGLRSSAFNVVVFTVALK
jgi:hypothetical protein